MGIVHSSKEHIINSVIANSIIYHYIMSTTQRGIEALKYYYKHYTWRRESTRIKYTIMYQTRIFTYTFMTIPLQQIR